MPARCKAAHDDDPGEAFFGWQREGDVEGHPVADKEEAVHEIGVLAQFPWVATARPSVSSAASVAAIALMAGSPRRSIAASI